MSETSNILWWKFPVRAKLSRPHKENFYSAACTQCHTGL